MFHDRHSAGRPEPGLEQNGRLYREYRVGGLEGLVRCRWEQLSGGVQRVIPDNCADIIVVGDGPAVLVGPATRVELPRLPVGARIRGLRFEPYVLRAVFGLPADELTDRTLPLDAVLGARAARMFEEEGPVREWLLARWDSAAPDRATVGVVRELTKPGATSVDTIAGGAGFSGRHLRRLVRAETGLGPKTLQRVARLHEFLRRARDTPVAAAALAAGYADQPHASREIRALTGVTPRQLLAERT